MPAIIGAARLLALFANARWKLFGRHTAIGNSFHANDSLDTRLSFFCSVKRPTYQVYRCNITKPQAFSSMQREKTIIARWEKARYRVEVPNKNTNLKRIFLFGRRNVPRWGLCAAWKRGKPCGLFMHWKDYEVPGRTNLFTPCKTCKVLHNVGDNPQSLSCKVALPYGLFNQGDILFPGQKDVCKDGVPYLCLPQCIKYKLQHIKNGKLHGKEVRWFKDGRVRSVAYFARGGKHGVETA